jgi:hypothetical protein
MSKIDVSKLTNAVKKDGKTVARCPACAARGGDAKGNNLVVFDDGKFGCAASPKDKDHNRLILQLVGVQEVKPDVYHVPVRRVQHAPSQVMKVVGRFGRSSATAPEVPVADPPPKMGDAEKLLLLPLDIRPSRPLEPSTEDSVLVPAYFPNSTERLIAEKGYVALADGRIVDPNRLGVYGAPTQVGWQQV